MLTSDDVGQICQLLARFAHHADAGDGAAFGALFAPGGLLDMGVSQVEGSDALVAFAASLPIRVPGVRHLMGSPMVEPAEGTDDSATATAHAAVYSCDEPTGSAKLIAVGTYVDDLVKIDGGWLLRTVRFKRTSV